ncbi:MAG: hypothetical protein IJW76_03930, partial [Clostridia bacterium]|nr:hypothetical protein [Clostridia bacterium]
DYDCTSNNSDDFGDDCKNNRLKSCNGANYCYHQCNRQYHRYHRYRHYHHFNNRYCHAAERPRRQRKRKIR